MERKPDPPPLRTDDVRTVQVGTALWTVALVVFAALREWSAVATCAAGIVLGVIGIVHTRRRAAAIARDEAAAAAASHNGPDPQGP